MTRFASTGAFIGLTLSLLFLSTAQSAKVEKYELKYYEEFVRFTKNFDSKGRIVNFYFYGEKNITGNSFCSDCDAAEPKIKEAFDNYGDNTVLVSVNIGDKDMWKDKNNSFRTDNDTLLTCIPVLLRWKHERGLQRKNLEEGQILKEKNLQWFFYVQEDYLKSEPNAKLERYSLKNHYEFVQFAKHYDAEDKLLTFFFCGEKNETGFSFCSDCHETAPKVEKALEKYGEDVVFVDVNVGDKETWKNETNKFRTDKYLKLTSIPTMIRWDDREKRLEDDEFSERNLDWFFRVEEKKEDETDEVK